MKKYSLILMKKKYPNARKLEKEIGKKVEKMYLKEMSGNKISKILNLDKNIIYKFLNEKKILTTRSESSKISAKNRIEYDRRGNKNSNWRGGRCIRQGYKYLYLPNHPLAMRNYYLEHRYIMENKIGRLLKRKEIVHHKDNNKLNNNIENLHLFKSHKEHAKFHIKLRRLDKNAKWNQYG